MSHPLIWVDAFTDTPFRGNPAAIVLLEAPADETWMQSLAFELGLAETAYVVPRTDGGFDLRWFTPTVEIPLCGHATLAARARAVRVRHRVGADHFPHALGCARLHSS